MRKYIHEWKLQDDTEWSYGFVPCFYGILGIEVEPPQQCSFKLEILLLQKILQFQKTDLEQI